MFEYFEIPYTAISIKIYGDDCGIFKVGEEYRGEKNTAITEIRFGRQQGHPEASFLCVRIKYLVPVFSVSVASSSKESMPDSRIEKIAQFVTSFGFFAEIEC